MLHGIYTKFSSVQFLCDLGSIWIKWLINMNPYVWKTSLAANPLSTGFASRQARMAKTSYRWYNVYVNIMSLIFTLPFPSRFALVHKILYLPIPCPSSQARCTDLWLLRTRTTVISGNFVLYSSDHWTQCQYHESYVSVLFTIRSSPQIFVFTDSLSTKSRTDRQTYDLPGPGTTTICGNYRC